MFKNSNHISKRFFSTRPSVPLSQFGGVHGNLSGLSRNWRNKPLFADRIFKTGNEAAQMLYAEAVRRDAGAEEFLATSQAMVNSLAVVFDRMPKYAWIMKQMLEPERSLTFRVAWLDDNGISRVHRGFRVQYSSTLGPYEGGQAFNAQVNMSYVKAKAFNQTFTNALSGKNIGGAYGGADFDPFTRSETEIQRFCQSYMTELSKYIGPDQDFPGLGHGVNAPEIGYLYGQYKRSTQHCGQVGQGLLWGGYPSYQQSQGIGAVYFAQRMLSEKGMSLEGKRCIITGSNYVALAVAEKLLELGAIPLTFTDSSGQLYEPDGFDLAKIKVVQKIKRERGARLGRYIIASTSAKYNDPECVYDIPCDYIFSCNNSKPMGERDVNALAQNGCKGILKQLKKPQISLTISKILEAIVEGVHRAVSNEGIAVAKKKGLLFAPGVATTVGASLFNGMTIAAEPLQSHVGETLDSRIEGAMNSIYDEVKATAQEFNTRGDLHAGANIASFIRLADIMLAHGSV